MPVTIKVIIAHSHPLVCHLLQEVLHRQQGIQVAGLANSFSRLQELTQSHRPAVIISDYLLPGLTDPAIIRQLTVKAGRCR